MDSHDTPGFPAARDHADHAPTGADGETAAPIRLLEPVDAADALDLLISVESREAGCFAVLPCTPDGAADRGLILVDDVPCDAEPTPLVRFLDLVLPMLKAEGRGAVIFARGRDGGVLVTDQDRMWHQAVLDACHRHDVALLSAHLATPAAVRAFPGDLRLAG